MHEHDTLKHLGDAISLSTVAATIMGWLPALAAFLSIVWTTIRIYETKTVQRLLGKESKDDNQQLDRFHSE